VCGRATLRIVLSTPCMMFASMMEIVIMPRFETGTNVSPLTADAPWAASPRRAAPHPLAASSPLSDLPAISNEVRARDGISKKRLMIVRSHSRLPFFSACLVSST
jgi:hypothetical protein